MSEPTKDELLEAFEMLGELAAMPSDRPNLNDHPDFQERRDELADDPLDSQRGNW